MRVAVLSDIHGNFEALQAVDKELRSREIEHVICLGDNIGYGPDPDLVVDYVRTRGFSSIMGNHEFALDDERGRRWLNFQAAENNLATRELLSTENRNYCASLPYYLEFDKSHFVHGYPKENVFRYINRQPDSQLMTLFGKYPSRCFFVGHTHLLQMIVLRNGALSRNKLGCGKVTLQGESRYIFNCGSVGQPRDKDNSAKYLLWDTRLHEVEVRYVPYDYSITIEKIKRRGFPAIYGERLR